MRNCIIVLFLLTSLVACQPKDKTTSKEISKEDTTVLPEDYISFYEKFHTDSLYQMSHIQWPLQGIQTEERDSNIINGRFYHKQENWLMHKSLSEEMGYSQSTKILADDLLEETMVDSQGQFGMKRRFAKISKEWYLIYYSGLNHIYGGNK